MEKEDIEELRARVGCAAVLEHEGFAIDRKASTRRAVKFRRDDDIVIVIHEDRGWFDACSDAKGDVFALVCYLRGVGFSDALAAVGDLVAFQPAAPAWEKPARQAQAVASVADRWEHRKRPWRASATWTYLRRCRALPWQVISAAIEQDVLREGPCGSMWAMRNAVATCFGKEKRADGEPRPIKCEGHGPPEGNSCCGGTGRKPPCASAEVFMHEFSSFRT